MQTLYFVPFLYESQMQVVLIYAERTDIVREWELSGRSIFLEDGDALYLILWEMILHVCVLVKFDPHKHIGGVQDT